MPAHGPIVGCGRFCGCYRRLKILRHIVRGGFIGSISIAASNLVQPAAALLTVLAMTIKHIAPILLIITLAVASATYPFESVTVPQWRVRFVDERQHPYVQIRVRQTWKDYTFETEPGQNGESRWTDSHGYVEFPRRTVRASAFKRVMSTLYNGFGALAAHGSLGKYASVDASGPQGYAEIEFRPGQPLPSELVLPSEP